MTDPKWFSKDLAKALDHKDRDITGEVIETINEYKLDHEIAERVRAEKKWLEDEIARNEWGLDYAEKLSEKINIINRLLGVSKEGA